MAARWPPHRFCSCQKLNLWGHSMGKHRVPEPLPLLLCHIWSWNLVRKTKSSVNTLLETPTVMTDLTLGERRILALIDDFGQILQSYVSFSLHCRKISFLQTLQENIRSLTSLKHSKDWLKAPQGLVHSRLYHLTVAVASSSKLPKVPQPLRGALVLSCAPFCDENQPWRFRCKHLPRFSVCCECSRR